MRKIKFRGKPLSKDISWQYGDVLHFEFLKNEVFIGGVKRDDYGKLFQSGIIVDPNTIGQFTELYDKNNNEIYEGDIVELDLNNEGKVMATVNYRRGCFVFDTPKEVYTVWQGDVLQKHIEVIGNIHDKGENI